MATIADFRTSVSQMSEDMLLETIRNIRRLRRMIPEKPVRKTKAKTKAPRTATVKTYMEKLTETEKQSMLAQLLKLRKGT